jgi:hypothetical protein
MVVARLRNASSAASKKLYYWMEHHPVVSNSILSFNLWIVGDNLAQWSEHNLKKRKTNKQVEDDGLSATTSTHQDNSQSSRPIDITPSSYGVFSNYGSGRWEYFDPIRTAQCASWGLVVGALLSRWYPFLDKVCVRNNLTGIWAASIAKVIADEFILDPPVITMFYGYMNICEGGTIDTFKQKIKSEFFPTWYASLAVWPVVLMGTFRFLPLYAQAPFINVCCIVWDGYLSYRNSLAKNADQESGIELIQQNQKHDETIEAPERPRVMNSRLHDNSSAAAASDVVSKQIRSAKKLQFCT